MMQVRRVLDFVLRLSPGAFKVVDELCTILEGIELTPNPVVSALRVACEARKATRRRRRRA